MAAYLTAVRFGSLVFGQLPTVDRTLRATGQVGAEVCAEQAQLCAINALVAIDALVGLNQVVP